MACDWRQEFFGDAVPGGIPMRPRAAQLHCLLHGWLFPFKPPGLLRHNPWQTFDLADKPFDIVATSSLCALHLAVVI